jgi:phage FluMu protein Com
MFWPHMTLAKGDLCPSQLKALLCHLNVHKNWAMVGSPGREYGSAIDHRQGKGNTHMRCAKCQKQLPQTNHYSGWMLSLTAGSLLVGGTSYAFTILNPALPVVAAAVAAIAFAVACQNGIRAHAASASRLDPSGVPCPHCTHVNFWTL